MRSKPGQSAMRIAYCGPIAQPGQPARGGYEAANRRLIDDLRLRGLDVMEFPYPVAQGNKASKGASYMWRFAGIGMELVQQRRRFDILHLTPLYRQFLYAEAILCLIAWSLGKRVVFDIRAGRFIPHYHNRGFVYRKLADHLISRADILALEGRENLPFAEERRAKPILYLPNYVKALTPLRDTERNSNVIRLIFLGRVVPEKGIETAIDTIQALEAEGLAAHLEVIGTGEQSYVAALRHRTEKHAVTWHGALPGDAIRARLGQAHFFIFPTRHAGEGHSNALTEAMAEGLVPICSKHGFNRSVVAQTGRLLSTDARPSDYAEAIAEVWRNDAWPALSAAARDRVARNFTSDVILSELIGHYAGMPIPSPN